MDRLQTAFIADLAGEPVAIDASAVDPMPDPLDALRRRMRESGFQMYLFARLARRLGVWDRVEPVAEGMSPR